MTFRWGLAGPAVSFSLLSSLTPPLHSRYNPNLLTLLPDSIIGLGLGIGDGLPLMFVIPTLVSS